MKTILVIEDEAQPREIFSRCLHFEGFHVLTAESGTVGVELAQKYIPDLIVCDIMMPDLDGYQVLSTLHQKPATAAIPFIFLTAKVTMADLRQGMELGADDYLTKPCTVEQLLAAINTRLARQEMLKRWSANNPQTNEELSKTTSSPPSIFPSNPKLDPVFRFIEAHYTQPISLTDVAQAAGYSPAYLTHLVQTQTGRTVKRWIIERRMVQARLLLTSTAQTVNHVAEAVGYADVSYFVRQFRQFHNASPQAWRIATEVQVAMS
ncbi:MULTISPECIES: response regulator [unclassified Leptolyngbya]|uniref:response regulator transcription factor n=1 Tax=unclassified Leptolyngbya TaxID=2650499 RepID=UPI0016843839|nr:MULTISPECIES: response regulator [unclassified Leptolyngbya]MBD1909019.1 response regulator [Leptolyngbya sp. FACHB-8]MBD2158081.1 response regulator [Leptolyngbya sp. FACHB-16]